MKKLILLPLAATLFFSCATTSQTEKTTVITQEQVKAELLGNAVPIYPGFKLISSKSFIYESGNIKVGRLVFVGDATIKDIVSYYKATLPDKGWEPVAITIYGNRAELTFTTPTQFLQIQAVKGFSQTTLIIQIGPKGELTNQEQ
ncbi:hypothetical protein [Thermovibrio sp.]